MEGFKWRVEYNSTTGNHHKSGMIDMPFMRSDLRELYKKIDEILWNDWDPIGLASQGLRDEYQDYLPEVVKFKLNGSAADILAKHLLRIEVEKMGLQGDPQKCSLVAEKILNL